MEKRTPLVFAAVFLLAAGVFAEPEAPTSLNGAFVPEENAIFISWRHPGGEGVSFEVFRGSRPETATVIATVEEINFWDREVAEDKDYAYYVVAVDTTGKTRSLDWLSVKTWGTVPFSIAVVEPSQNAYPAGETIDFVVRIESMFFDDLEDVRVVLVNAEFGVNEVFSPGPEKGTFVVSTLLPRAQEFEGLSTTYSIGATATFEGEQYLETKPVSLLITPVQEIDVGQLAANIWGLGGPAFIFLMIISTVIFVGWKWFLHKKAEKDRLKQEELGIQKEREIWKHEVFKRKITPEQFREKEGELQGKLAAVEEKLGVKVERGKKRVNPFQGFSPPEAEEVMRLVKSIGKPKKNETKESLRARLVGLGRTEKIAKKVSELVFR